MKKPKTDDMQAPIKKTHALRLVNILVKNALTNQSTIYSTEKFSGTYIKVLIHNIGFILM